MAKEIYEIYFFSEPYLMVLEDDSIIDINIRKETPVYRKWTRSYGVPPRKST